MTGPHHANDLAVIICTKDNRRTIERSLRSVEGLWRRLVVVDSGSTDGTIEQCESFGAELLHRAWGGFIAQRQFALDQCRDHRWVLSLDADESLEPALRQSIATVVEQDDDQFAGWRMNRKVWFMGDWLHHVFQPEWRLRLVRGGRARVVGVEPHDTVEVHGGQVGRLQGDLRHDSWADLDDLLARHQRYARQAAAAGAAGGSAWDLLTRGPATTLKQLVLKGGWRDGRRGLAVSLAAGLGVTTKHLLIASRRWGRGD